MIKKLIVAGIFGVLCNGAMHASQELVKFSKYSYTTISTSGDESEEEAKEQHEHKIGIGVLNDLMANKPDVANVVYSYLDNKDYNTKKQIPFYSYFVPCALPDGRILLHRNVWDPETNTFTELKLACESSGNTPVISFGDRIVSGDIVNGKPQVKIFDLQDIKKKPITLESEHPVRGLGQLKDGRLLVLSQNFNDTSKDTMKLDKYIFSAWDLQSFKKEEYYELQIEQPKKKWYDFSGTSKYVSNMVVLDKDQIAVMFVEYCNIYIIDPNAEKSYVMLPNVTSPRGITRLVDGRLLSVPVADSKTFHIYDPKTRKQTPLEFSHLAAPQDMFEESIKVVPLSEDQIVVTYNGGSFASIFNINAPTQKPIILDTKKSNVSSTSACVLACGRLAFRCKDDMHLFNMSEASAIKGEVMAAKRKEREVEADDKPKQSSCFVQ